MRFKPLNILLLLSLLLTATSCVDDELYENAKVGDGYAMINANVSFFEMPVDLSSRAGENATNPTGGTPGTAIGNIESLCVVVYDKQGNFIRTYTHDPDNNLDQLENYKYTPKSNSETPNDAVGNNEHQAETTTGEAQFSIGTKNIKDRLRYGEYKMYAIANMGQISDEICQQGEEALKTQLLTWNKGNIASNNQMFGYFTLMNGNKKGLDSAGFNAPTILIDKVQSNVHSWIKRAVSKVTVAFDGTNLNNGVQIFIKSVTIKDIPAKCYLGADNPNQADDPATELIENSGQMITYGTGENYTTDWLGYVSKDHPVNGFDQAVVADDKLTSEQKLAQLHSEQTNALFLFENMQGKGKENTPSDKRQQVNQKHIDDKVVSYPDGYDPTNIAWKDAKKYGSYIEVQAYYRAQNTDGSLNEKEGEGPITYRFMLGKDTRLDYNTQRNYHYKLTLKFNKWANDVDWHIEYKKHTDPKLRFPHPFYISYLYGQSTMIPIEFDAPENSEIISIDANIIENNWAPYECTSGWNGTLNQTDLTTIKASQPDKNMYGNYYKFLSTPDIVNGKPWNGFLSLKKPTNILRIPTPTGNELIHNEPSVFNEPHYNNNDLGHRSYTNIGISKEPLYKALDEDKAHVSWADGTFFVKIPIWTRARQMIKETAYTGNNPYTAYKRMAKVNVVIKYRDGETNEIKTLDSNNVDFTGNKTQDIEIQQVRRIVNPKGIFHSDSYHEDFHVEMKILKDDNTTNFTNLISDGPWRAYVIRDTEADNGGAPFVTLDIPKDSKSTKAEYTFQYSGEVLTRNSIEGIDNTPIDFYIKFDKTTPSKPRYAIIRVEYNYCSCHHLIFVRQGYAADDIVGNGRKWCTINNYDRNNLANNPLDEGSLFRFGNWTGIKSESNVNKGKTNWVKIAPNDFLYNGGTNLKLTNEKTQNWDKITNSDPSKSSFPAPGGGRRIATLADYNEFLSPNKDNDNTWHIKNGYGVCYGDGATETATTMDEAYGYKYTSGNGQSPKGMRGCFVYNTKTGKNLFFPIGSSGYGHRKHLVNGINGLLRYSCSSRWGYFDATSTKNNDGKTPYGLYKYGIYEAPLFLDVFRSPGAIYWFDKEYSVNDVGYPAWDINYETFDFISISHVNVYSSGGADACFIRCISTQ